MVATVANRVIYGFTAVASGSSSHCSSRCSLFGGLHSKRCVNTRSTWYKPTRSADDLEKKSVLYLPVLVYFQEMRRMTTFCEYYSNMMVRVINERPLSSQTSLHDLSTGSEGPAAERFFSLSRTHLCPATRPKNRKSAQRSASTKVDGVTVVESPCAGSLKVLSRFCAGCCVELVQGFKSSFFVASKQGRGNGSAAARAPHSNSVRRYTQTHTPSSTLELPLVYPLPCRPNCSSRSYVLCRTPSACGIPLLSYNIRRHPVVGIDYMTSFPTSRASRRSFTVYASRTFETHFYNTWDLGKSQVEARGLKPSELWRE